jgi:hypothetical protein
MTHEEFLENMTKALNDFLVEMVHENDKRADKIEKMALETRSEMRELIHEVNLMRNAIGKKWGLEAIEAKMDKVREVFIAFASLRNPDSLINRHYFSYLANPKYKEWEQSKGIERDLEEIIEDARWEQFLIILDELEKKLLYIFEIKDVDDFML